MPVKTGFGYRPRCLAKKIRYGFARYICTLGKDVDIERNAYFTSQLVVGDGCVIGAGAVVTMDVPLYSAVGGVPARILRSRIPE